MTKEKTKGSLSNIRWVQLALLAGGAGCISFLPYLRTSFYGPMMEAMSLTNTQIGLISSMYGILTIICYFPGGWLADRFSPRKMLTISFILTGLGGLWYAQFPSFNQLMILHVFFGITTTLTFWATMIKAARQCGPADAQGKIYGLLEGIRRLLSTVVGLGTVYLFASFASEVAGLKAVIYTYSILLLIVGLLTWFLFTDDMGESETDKPQISGLDGLKKACRIPAVWLIGVIIFCAYASYSLADYLTPYFTNVCGVSAALGAVLATIRTYAIGPFGSILGGFAGDKFTPSKTMLFGFVITCACNIVYIFVPGTPTLLIYVISNMLIMMTAHFAIRGLYYALLEEGGVPVYITGTATGIIATIGYMPDAFIWTLAGWILDTNPGLAGYNIIFGMAAGFAGLGFVFAFIFNSLAHKKIQQKQGESPL